MTPRGKTFWTLYGIIFVFSFCLLTGSLWYGYHQLRTSAMAETHSIATAMDELNRRQLEAMAIPLEAVTTQILEAGGLNAFPENRLDSLFYKNQSSMTTSRVRSFFAINSEGRFVGTSYLPAESEKFGRQPSFKGQPEWDYIRTQKGSMVLSSAVSPVDRRKILILMKPLRTREGRFAGIIGVTKAVDEFEAFYKSLDLPYGVTFTMFRDDGMVLYRYPDHESLSGKKVRISEQIQPNSEGMIEGSGPGEGTEKIGYYKFTSEFGGWIYVGYNTEALYRGFAVVTETGFTLFFLFMAVLAGLVKIAHRRQTALETAFAERSYKEDLVHRIQTVVETRTGPDFLRALSQQIAEVFEVGNVAIGVLLPEHPGRVKFLVNWVNGEWGAEYDYDLRGSPFNDLPPGEFFVYPRNASQIFGKDPLLSARKIESCMGVKLQDGEHRPTGVLLVYDEGPLEDLEMKRVVLSVFAARAGAELERLRADEIRKEVERLRRQIEERGLQAEKLQAIGGLAEGIAHDFNNILAIILASSEKMLSLYEHSKDRHYLEAIRNACHRARHLVSQIVVFSRKDDGDMHAVALKNVFEEVVSFMRATLPAQTSLRLEMNDCPDLMIHADVNQIQHALMNLCVNAARNMEATGGEIRIQLKRTQIKNRPYVKWIIQGSGKGAEAEEAASPLNPFYAQNLGLVIVQKIITNHGGFVEVKAESGLGTTFEIFLPVVEGPRAEDAKRKFQFRSSRKVMIVDDEPEIGCLIKELLEIEGLAVDTFSEPEQALKVFTLQPEQYFLIISDLSMPGMTGYVFARKIRERDPKISMILWSGYQQFLDQEMQELNLKTLSKPVDVAKLLTMIQAELSQQPAPSISREYRDPGIAPSVHP
jgi:signal transduction histidine kinase/CheY-like chemotaxis protein